MLFSTPMLVGVEAQLGQGKLNICYINHIQQEGLCCDADDTVKQGSHSARLSPKNMIHYARKLFQCSLRIVQSFKIL